MASGEGQEVITKEVVADIIVVVTGQHGTVGILGVLSVTGLAPEVQRGDLHHLTDLEADLRNLTSPRLHQDHQRPVLLPVIASRQ